MTLSLSQLLIGPRLKKKLPTTVGLLEPQLHKDVHVKLKERQIKTNITSIEGQETCLLYMKGK